MMRTIPSNTDDVLDTRDLVEYAEELKGSLPFECPECLEYFAEPDEDGDCPECGHDSPSHNADADESSAEEYAGLVAFLEEVESYSGDSLTCGVALIADDHWEDYAKQYAEDVGALESGAGWPHSCIDWEAAAEELQIDYSSADWNGAEYWFR